MDTNTFHFNVGYFDCIAVSDGGVTGEDAAQVLFTNAPKILLKQTLRTYRFPTDQWTEFFTCLVIKTGEHCILVDTGLGLIEGDPNVGKLIPNLHSEGIEPDDIDTVIISHAHGDHIGGNTDTDGHVSFPRARYYIRKEEWDFWTSEKTLENPAHRWMAEFVYKNLLAIQDRFYFLA